MSIFYVIVLSVVSFAVLFLLSKLIGNRQMSELNMFDYINGITIGSIAAEMATDIEHFEKPLVAMIAYGILSWLFSIMTNKSVAVRRFLAGKSVILMNNGKIYRENLKMAKLDINDMLTQLRVSGYFNPDDIKTAVLESNGKISVLPKASARPATNSDIKNPVSEDSICINVIMEDWKTKIVCGLNSDYNKVIAATEYEKNENLKKAGLDKNWIQKQLAGLGIGKTSDVYLGFVNPDGNLSAYKFENALDKNDVFQ